MAWLRSKSMVQEKEEAREKARLLRIAKRDEEMLGDFPKKRSWFHGIGDCIRMLDYMFQAHFRLSERFYVTGSLGADRL